MKLFKKLFVTFASLTLLGSAIACTPKEEAKLEKITITSEPTKKEYYVGDSLDLTGLEVTAFYSNSTFKVVEDYETSGFNSSAANPSVTVTVTYKSKTASFTVSVREALQEFSITYYVNNGTDFSMLDTLHCVFPSRAVEGSRVDIKVAAKDGFDYRGFFVTGPDVPDDFYDQFEDYSMKESEFSFIMPHSTVIVYLSAETHAERYEATFATVAHASFSFQGSLESPFKEGDKVQFNVVVDYGYEMVGLPFIVGDSSIEVSVSPTYIYSFTMPAKAVEISANVQERVVTTYKVTLDTVANATLSKHPSVEDLNNVEPGALVVINVVVESGYELVGKPFIVGDASITVTKSDTATNGWQFFMPEKNVTFSCTVQSSTPATKYAVSFTSIPHISFHLSGTSETSFAPETYVNFYTTLDSGYRIVGLPYVVGDPSIEVVSFSSYYQFQMPSKAVEIAADVEVIPTFSVTIDNTVEHVTMDGQGDLSSVPAGSQVVIIVVPASGYELDGLPFIVGDASVTVHKSMTVTNGYYFSMPEKNVTFSCTIVESVVTKYNVTFDTIPYVTFNQHPSTENPCEPGENFMFAIELVEGVEINNGPYIVGDPSITINSDQYGAYYFFTMPAKDVTVTLTTTGTPKVLDHISIEGTPKTEYNVNEQFVKPTIRAYYTDSYHQSEIVTNSASFTGYDLSTAGNYTVTVSYSKGGVTDTKTYNITVSGKTPSTSIVFDKLYSFYTSNTHVKGFRFMFKADGTGYYERYWANDSTDTINRVWFTYEFHETTITATFDHYDADHQSTLKRFDNKYKIFIRDDDHTAVDYPNYQSIDISVFTDSVEVYLLSLNADETVTRETTAKSFVLED